MKLEELLRGIETERVHGNLAQDVRALAYDSRRVGPGDVFVALRGESVDGHDYVRLALKAGATAAIVEDASLFKTLAGEGAKALVLVPDTRRALSRASALWFGSPSVTMKLVGITGTNGKTTTSYLIEGILAKAGLVPGVLGTVNYRLGEKIWPSTHTTPESLELQGLLAEMKKAGARSAVMEVSSHALAQRRVSGLEFDAVVFTNLTQDHLDYHADMEDYFAAKRILFTDQLAGQEAKRSAPSVLNIDDSYGQRLYSELSAAGRPVVSFGLRPSVCFENGREKSPDIFPEELSWGASGLSARIHSPAGDLQVISPLVGEHNVYNVLSAVGAGIALGIGADTIAAGIASVACVPGRLEPVPNDLGILTLVDYAHTPHALRNVLAAVRGLTDGKVICVFGCGGDRDPTKRVPMAEAVSELSDLPVLTSDNPRTEDPAKIIARTREGFSGKEGVDFLVEIDRRKAIALAIGRAQKGDLVLIAGKGHEDYQIIGKEKQPFDDRVEARRVFKVLEGKRP